MINVDKVAPKIADTANTVWNWEQFEGGNIGMLIDGPWTVTNVVNYCDFNVGYSIIPKAEKQVTTINGSALAVTSESKHPKEHIKHWKFLQARKHRNFWQRMEEHFRHVIR